MTRLFFALAVAVALFGTMLASSTPSFAQVRGDNWMQLQGGFYGPGAYDRAVNGSQASTPGSN